MNDKEFYIPEELPVPEELHVPQEYVDVPDPFTVGPFCIAPPTEYVSDEKEYVPPKAEEGAGRRRKDIMQMMYFAALLSSVASITNYLGNKDKTFDMNAYIREHRDWAGEGDQYLYLGNDHWGFTAGPGEGGNNFTRFRYNLEQVSEYSCKVYAFDFDWTTYMVVKSEAMVTFIKDGDGYKMDVYDTAHPETHLTFKYLKPEISMYSEKKEMLEIHDLSTQEILNRYNTFYIEHDAPVYGDITKIVFNTDKTGFVYDGKKQKPFTYRLGEDTCDPSITMDVGGDEISAVLLFDSDIGLLGLKLLGKGSNAFSFASFVPLETPEQPSETEEQPSETEETKPSGKKTKETKATEKALTLSEYLDGHRDWKTGSGSMYLYIGSSGWGYVALPGMGNAGNAEFRRFRIDEIKDGDNLIKCTTYMWDGSSSELQKQEFTLEFTPYSKSKGKGKGNEQGFTMELCRPGTPSNQKFEAVEAQDVPAECTGEMRRIHDLSMQQLLSRYGSYHINEDRPVTDNFDRMEFSGNGTGNLYMNGEAHPFTYSFNGDDADQTIHINVDGHDVHAFLSFDGGLVAIRFFGYIEDAGHFGYFLAD